MSAARPFTNFSKASALPAFPPTTMIFNSAARRLELATEDRISTTGGESFNFLITFTDAAARTFSIREVANSFRATGSNCEGLCTNSTAPNSRDRKAASPELANEETITTGIGRCFMIFSKNITPDIFGISISKVITSGFVCKINSRA
ncbi:hypothetical protein D3C87_1138640 [compost metagenome]